LRHFASFERKPAPKFGGVMKGGQVK
jgi:hypothetical protein